jgi:hypothetical protein
MRCVLPLLALCALSSVSLRASDIFDITLSGTTLSGSGTLTTDGICSDCFPGLGLLSLTINIGINSGPAAFDIIDDFDTGAPPTEYDRSNNLLTYGRINSETGDSVLLTRSPFRAWSLSHGGMVEAIGGVSITPAATPEPPPLFLLMPIVAILVLRWRYPLFCRPVSSSPTPREEVVQPGN